MSYEFVKKNSVELEDSAKMSYFVNKVENLNIRFFLFPDESGENKFNIISIKKKSFEKIFDLLDIKNDNILPYLFFIYTTSEITKHVETQIHYNIKYEELIKIIKYFYILIGENNIQLNINSIDKILSMNEIEKSQRVEYFDIFNVDEEENEEIFVKKKSKVFKVKRTFVIYDEENKEINHAKKMRRNNIFDINIIIESVDKKIEEQKKEKEEKEKLEREEKERLEREEKERLEREEKERLEREEKERLEREEKERLEREEKERLEREEKERLEREEKERLEREEKERLEREEKERLEKEEKERLEKEEKERLEKEEKERLEKEEKERLEKEEKEKFETIKIENNIEPERDVLQDKTLIQGAEAEINSELNNDLIEKENNLNSPSNKKPKPKNKKINDNNINSENNQQINIPETQKNPINNSDIIPKDDNSMPKKPIKFKNKKDKNDFDLNDKSNNYENSNFNQIKVKFPFIYEPPEEDQNYDHFVTGNLDKIGNWDPNKALKLEKEIRNNKLFYMGSIEVETNDIPFEYKYFCIKNDKIDWKGIPFVNLYSGPKEIFNVILKDSNKRIGIFDLNIRYLNTVDGNNIWDNRKEKLINIMLKAAPDIIFFQEITRQQFDYIEHNMGALYESIGYYRDETEKSEKTCITFNKSKFVLNDWGQFWLSSTPDKKGSNDFNNFFPRMCTWASLKKLDSEDYIFFNIHLDHVNMDAHLPCMKVVIEESEKILKDNLKPKFMFIGGCFYCEENDPILDLLKNNGYKEIIFENTFHDFTGNADRHWDYMFYKDLNINDNKEIKLNKVNVLKNEAIIDKEKNMYVSDHYPINAEFFEDIGNDEKIIYN
jgi:endonuclease/exonuclease/phosphatase family metal-dependent hydrolase